MTLIEWSKLSELSLFSFEKRDRRASWGAVTRIPRRASVTVSGCTIGALKLLFHSIPMGAASALRVAHVPNPDCLLHPWVGG